MSVRRRQRELRDGSRRKRRAPSAECRDGEEAGGGRQTRGGRGGKGEEEKRANDAAEEGFGSGCGLALHTYARCPRGFRGRGRRRRRQEGFALTLRRPPGPPSGTDGVQVIF
jgi:hypothetical protein